jgi:hypothetical protein
MKEDDFVMNILNIDDTRRLMFSSDLFEKEIDVTRDVGHWNKLSHPAIFKTLEWEAWGPYGFMGLHRDDAEDNWKMWYTCTGVDGSLGKYAYGMAHSEDGLNWTKFDSPLALPEDAQPGSVVVKPGMTVDDYRIFCMQYAKPGKGLPGRALLSKSKDGLNFIPVNGTWEESWFEGPSDVIALMWDEIDNCFRSYFKQWRIYYDNNGQHLDYLFSHFTKFEHDEANKKYHLAGNIFWPEKKRIELELSYEGLLMQFEGPNKYPLGNEFFMHRVVSSAKSNDFLNWDYIGPVLIPEKGKTADQFYGMHVIQYQKQYVGLPLMYNGITGTMETGIACSVDGVEFKLVTENPLIARGEQGHFDSGMVLGFGDILQVDDRLSLYFGAISRTHDEPVTEKDTFSIGRAWNRLDGFCAVTGGTVITRPLFLENGKLHINAEGIINIKIDDMDGNTLTDFEWGGNRMDLAICHPQIRKGVPYKIEFTVKEGALYSFWSGDTCTSRQ